MFVSKKRFEEIDRKMEGANSYSEWDAATEYKTGDKFILPNGQIATVLDKEA